MRRKLNVCSNSTAKKFEKRKIRLELHTQIRKYCHGRPILRNKLICRLSCLKSGKRYLLDKYISTLWIAQYDSLESDHPLDSAIHSLNIKSFYLHGSSLFWGKLVSLVDALIATLGDGFMNCVVLLLCAPLPVHESGTSPSNVTGESSLIGM